MSFCVLIMIVIKWLLFLFLTMSVLWFLPQIGATMKETKIIFTLRAGFVSILGSERDFMAAAACRTIHWWPQYTDSGRESLLQPGPMHLGDAAFSSSSTGCLISTWDPTHRLDKVIRAQLKSLMCVDQVWWQLHKNPRRSRGGALAIYIMICLVDVHNVVFKWTIQIVVL